MQSESSLSSLSVGVHGQLKHRHLTPQDSTLKIIASAALAPSSPSPTSPTISPPSQQEPASAAATEAQLPANVITAPLNPSKSSISSFFRNINATEVEPTNTPIAPTALAANTPPKLFRPSNTTTLLQVGTTGTVSASFFTPLGTNEPFAKSGSGRTLLSTLGIGSPKAKPKNSEPISGKSVPLTPPELADLLVPQGQNPSTDPERIPPLLIDLRSLAEYQTGHIVGSFNVNLPTLLVKRYRRGSVSNFNLESFITTPEGKEEFMLRSASDCVVVYDESMDETKQDLPSWALLGVMEKEVSRTSVRKVCWLRGGYTAFAEWDTTRAYRTTEDAQSKGTRERSATVFSVNTAPRLSLAGCAAKKRSSGATSRSSSAGPPRKFKDCTKNSMSDTRIDEASIDPNINNQGELGTRDSVPDLTKEMGQLQPMSASADEPTSASGDPMEMSPARSGGGPLSSPSSFEITEVLPGVLYLGSDINPIMLRELEELGVRRVLNMAFDCFDNSGLQQREGWTYRKLHVQDHTNENIEDVFDEVVEYISAAKAAGEPIYVHCKAGKSRSATAVLAYLVKGEGWTLRKAYDYLRARRTSVSPNIGFITSLMRLEKKLYGRGTFVEGDDPWSGRMAGTMGESSSSDESSGFPAEMMESPVDMSPNRTLPAESLTMSIEEKRPPSLQ